MLCIGRPFLEEQSAKVGEMLAVPVGSARAEGPAGVSTTGPSPSAWRPAREQWPAGFPYHGGV